MSLLDKIYTVEYIFQASDNYDTVTTKVMKCAINNVEYRSNLQIVVCKSFVIIQVTVEHLAKIRFQQKQQNVN